MVTALSAALLRTSRPRFWLYTAGSFMIGWTTHLTSLSDYLNPLFLLLILFFTLPANFFIYGVNDLSDEETDKLNPKKQTHEQLLSRELHSSVIKWCIALVIVAVIALPLLQNSLSQILWIAFFGLSAAYSLKPIRFKSKPGLDAASNFLYVIPGLLGYSLTTASLPSMLIVILCLLWVMAMQIYSAIPDIDYDRKAGIPTYATTVGRRGALITCICLWLCVAVGAILVTKQPVFILGLAYPALPLANLLSQKADIKRLYWIFPMLNAGIGFLLFLYIFISRINI